MGWEYKTKETACFKLVIWYTNGAVRPYYSRDWNGEKFSPGHGLKALEDFVAKNAHLVRHAMIWDKRWGRDWLIRECKNHNDGWLVNAPVQF